MNFSNYKKFNKLILVTAILSILNCCNRNGFSTHYADNIPKLNYNRNSPYKPYQCKSKNRILSIDGGGVRGIIAARILAEIEKRANNHIAELFDLAVGTSTGGLIVSALGIPDDSNQAKYDANSLVKLYLNKSKNIFDQSFVRDVETGGGLWGAKYNRDNFDRILYDLFSDILLSQTIYPIYIPIYSIDRNKPELINSISARKDIKSDFYLRDLAGATSAAPTYFTPKIFSNIDNTVTYTAADGGIYANDPEILAAISIYKLCPKLNIDELVFVSIGTGEVTEQAQKVAGNSGIIDWLKNRDLIGDIMASESKLSDEAISIVFKHNKYRLQVKVPKKLDILDDTNHDNLELLLKITEEYIEKNSDLIDEIVAELSSK